MNESEDILVSVTVITYNSSKYVLETLDSIKAQTYQNIELIISDDCSGDNTMQLCKNWCEQNKERFARIQYVEVEQNTGVSANCNRADCACQGEWVKLIAGDDLLLPNCITDFMEYVIKNQDVVCVFGKIEIFDEKHKKVIKNDTWPNYSIFKLNTSHDQYEYLLNKGNGIPAASCFYNRKRMLDLGIRYDERIPFIEDRPRWLQLLRKEVILHFVDKTVVRYRTSHKNSLSSGMLYNDKYYSSGRLVYFYYYFPEKYEKDKDSCIKDLVQYETRIYMNYISVLNSTAFRIGCFLLKPIYILKRFFV